MRCAARCLAGFFALLFLSCQAPVGHAPKQIIGYYPLWEFAARDTLVRPETIPYRQLTMVNVAFFYPLADGRITLADSLQPVADLVLGGKSGESLVERAHRAGTRVLISLGGWANSEHFPAAASSEASRRRFAGECVALVQKYGIDGIDIDWEYPGYAPHNGTPSDRANFTLLLRTVRDSLNALARTVGKPLLLTAALPADRHNVSQLEVGKIAELLDYLNLMTYDLYGVWFPYAYHHAPLYPGRCGDPTRNADAAFRLYRSYGVPAQKINLGVPFYGRTFAGCDSLCAPHSGADVQHFPPAGVPLYYQILHLLPQFDYHWDAQAGVPYLTSGRWHTLISFEDERSAALKARYVRQKGAAGLIVWEITGDALPDGSHPLLDAIFSEFNRPEKDSLPLSLWEH